MDPEEVTYENVKMSEESSLFFEYNLENTAKGKTTYGFPILVFNPVTCKESQSMHFLSLMDPEAILVLFSQEEDLIISLR